MVQPKQGTMQAPAWELPALRLFSCGQMPDPRSPCIIVNLTERLKDTHLGRRWLFFFLSVSSRSLQLA